MKTLEDLKTEKAEFRMKMNRERKRLGYIRLQTAKEYCVVLALIEEIESKLLKPIVISIILALILSIGGCNAARSTLNLGKSIGQDGAWILGKMSDNITTEK